MTYVSGTATMYCPCREVIAVTFDNTTTEELSEHIAERTYQYGWRNGRCPQCCRETETENEDQREYHLRHIE